MLVPALRLNPEEILKSLAALQKAVERQERVIERQNARIRELEQIVVQKDRRIAELENQVRKLESQLAQAKKNSATSAKPPSSDIVKPKSAPRRSKRRKGGQNGHPRHERPPFTPDQVRVTVHTLKVCPVCGGELRPAQTLPNLIQQIELTETPIRIDEHRGLAYWCEHCRKIHYAPLPETVVKGGLIGPALTAHIGYLKGMCHLSYSGIARYLAEFLAIPGQPFSHGFLVKVVQKVSAALARPYRELEARLALEKLLNIDETGHKENGDRLWTWCFRAELFTLFHIAETRGSEVLFDLLGAEFAGVIGCDLFSAYRKFMANSSALVQFCLAHLIRDVRYLTTLSDPATQRYGERLLEGLRRLFRIIHRRDRLTEPGFRRNLEKERDRLIATAKRAPRQREAQNLATRFHDYGEAYFTFITTPGLEPTNNLAEQAIRFVVIDRHITQGTRSERGREWSERIWTVIATCAQQGRSVHEFIRAAVNAYFTNQPAPSLLISTG